MSKKLFLLPALLLGAFLMFTPACGDDDPCKDVVCDTATSDCFEGECICKVGFEKDAAGNCVDEVDRLVGKWSTLEKCSTDPSAQPYDLTIAKGSASKTIDIFNFYNSFASTPVKATVNGNTITIARQTPVSGGTIQVEGSGTISIVSGKLNIALKYTATEGANKAECNNTVLIKN